jgi:hypothetical protein
MYKILLFRLTLSVQSTLNRRYPVGTAKLCPFFPFAYRPKKMCAKLSKTHRGQRSQKGTQHQEQRNEAVSIQQEFGLYHDYLNVVGETVNLMTPDEVTYYLGVTFQGVLLSAIPSTVERALVLENKLQYQLTTIYQTVHTDSEETEEE